MARIHSYRVLLVICLIRGQNCCQRMTYDQIRLYLDAQYTGGYPLTCIRNIGLKACLMECERHPGCNIGNYHKAELTCELRTTLDLEEDGSLTTAVNNSAFTLTALFIYRKTPYSMICFHPTGIQTKKCFPIRAKCCPEKYIGDSDMGVTFSDVYVKKNGYLGDYRLTSSSCWAPPSSIIGHWVQVVFSKVHLVIAVVTKGRNGIQQWVTSFVLEAQGIDGNWMTVVNHLGQEQVFQGNTDHDTSKRNELPFPVLAKGIKIYPRGFHGYMSLRFGVVGCA